MKTILVRSLLAAMASLVVTAAACSDPPKDDTISAKAVTQDVLPEQKQIAPVIPDYTPTGDDADLKKQGAAGITADNAKEKAAELEGSIDAATKAVAAKKT